MNYPASYGNSFYSRDVPKVSLLVDPRGWPKAPDPELVASMVSAKLPNDAALAFDAIPVDGRWAGELPRDSQLGFALISGDSDYSTIDTLTNWINGGHLFYMLYTDAVDANLRRAVAQLTSDYAVPRAPYRIVQLNSGGLDNAARWIAEVITRTVELPPPVPSVRVQATRWQNIPSNARAQHSVPDQVTLSIPGAGGTQLLAASTRGKTHAHQGGYREDAFALAATPAWNILAVADGAGTAQFARLGSNTAVREAVNAIQKSAPVLPTADDIGQALIDGLKAARTSLTDLAEDEHLALEDLHTTLLLMIHAPTRDGCVTGMIHIGDGLIAAESANRELYLLTEPDTDPDDNGATLFLTSGTMRQWASRARVFQFDSPLEIITLMTDGLANDLEPREHLLQPNLFEPLRRRILCYPPNQREQALLGLISYERRGSFDDRTLVVLTTR